MPVPNIVVVTGASGAGKTTLVCELDQRALAGVRCYYFDSIGVPSPETMVAQFGSSSAWQEAMTRQWVARLAANVDEAQMPALASRDMAAWAAYLRGQADALGLPIVDTTTATVTAATDALSQWVMAAG